MRSNKLINIIAEECGKVLKELYVPDENIDADSLRRIRGRKFKEVTPIKSPEHMRALTRRNLDNPNRSQPEPTSGRPAHLSPISRDTELKRQQRHANAVVASASSQADQMKDEFADEDWGDLDLPQDAIPIGEIKKMIEEETSGVMDELFVLDSDLADLEASDEEEKLNPRKHSGRPFGREPIQPKRRVDFSTDDVRTIKGPSVNRDPGTPTAVKQHRQKGPRTANIPTKDGPTRDAITKPRPRYRDPRIKQ